MTVTTTDHFLSTDRVPRVVLSTTGALVSGLCCTAQTPYTSRTPTPQQPHRCCLRMTPSLQEGRKLWWSSCSPPPSGHSRPRPPPGSCDCWSPGQLGPSRASALRTRTGKHSCLSCLAWQAAPEPPWCHDDPRGPGFPDAERSGALLDPTILPKPPPPPRSASCFL